MKLILTTVLLIALATSCPTDERCARCNGNTCELCFDGFLVNGVCQKNKLAVQNCLSYKSDGVCQRCDSGYYVNQVGACSMIFQDFCLTYTLGDTCTSCSNKIKVTNGGCETKVYCSSSNCERCNAGDICQWCESGFVLSKNNLCIVAVGAQANCMRLGDNGCQECKYGYFNKNGSCEKASWFKAAGVMGAAIIGLISAILI